MRERVFDKQNNYSMAYQLRARQYSQVDPQRETGVREKDPQRQYSYYEPKTFEKKINNLQDALPYQRLPQRQGTFDTGIAKNSRPQGVGNYARKRYQMAPKIDFEEQKPRFSNTQAYNKRQDTYADHSFGQNSFQNDASMPLPNKRETAKRKGMEIKMTNIENINDKINSLLSMVKKDKIDHNQRQKIFENSPKRNQSPSPIMNRANVLANIQAFQNKQSVRSGAKANKVDPYIEKSKSNKRLKTYSAVQSNKYDEYQYNQAKQFNEEDKRIPETSYYPSNNYSPAKNRILPKQDYNHEKMRNQRPQNSQKMQYNHYKYTPMKQRNDKRGTESSNKESSSKTVEPKRVGSKNYQNINPSKYEKNELQYNKLPSERANLYQKREKTPSRQNGDNFMPISLMQNQISLDRSRNQKNQNNSSSMKMVDNQIKKIKEKISQSQYQYKKYQERLVDAREERSPNNAGRIYTTDSGSSTKKFQIKVQPVINDKPQTVKIAQRICYQIEMDNRMRRARQSFQKIEGQQKWRDLEQKLNRNGSRLTFLQLKDLLAVTPDQFSPFDNIEAAQQDIIKPFLDSQKFWEKEVCGCASSKSLRKEGFSINELDLNKKGHLSIEDIVCFVNVHTAHCYKNRDLTVIFRRLQLLEKCKKGYEIDFNTFFRAFTI